MKQRLVRLFVTSRLSKENEILDNELSFLSIESLLGKYNEIVNNFAKQNVEAPARDIFIKQYGVDAVIETADKVILKELIIISSFSFYS